MVCSGGGRGGIRPSTLHQLIARPIFLRVSVFCVGLHDLRAESGRATLSLPPSLPPSPTVLSATNTSLALHPALQSYWVAKALKGIIWSLEWKKSRLPFTTSQPIYTLGILRYQFRVHCTLHIRQCVCTFCTVSSVHIRACIRSKKYSFMSTSKYRYRAILWR